MQPEVTTGDVPAKNIACRCVMGCIKFLYFPLMTFATVLWGYNNGYDLILMLYGIFIGWVSFVAFITAYIGTVMF